MDNPDDFVFLLEEVANRFNPYLQDEYLVIQTRSGNLSLHALHRGFDYQVARDFAEMENLGSDYNHYSVRVMHNGKLHCVDSSGNPTTLSREQDWKIHSDYPTAFLTDERECGIEVCECSYPTFWGWGNTINSQGEAVEVWRAVTCLEGDNGREIDTCPNCGISLTSEDELEADDGWDWEQIPEVCTGCKYYAYLDEIVCALHPFGAEGDFCPDYSN
jgi:hypothetical protein